MTRSPKAVGGVSGTLGNLRGKLSDGVPVEICRAGGAGGSAVAFLIARESRLHPEKSLLVIVAGLKEQEVFHQDLATWRRLLGSENDLEPGFFPAWENLPHESKLPHADVVSERLECLVREIQPATARGKAPRLMVASATAVLQKTFPRKELIERTRHIRVGDRLNPLDWIEWLEEQGYEPEAQVTGKGELSWRGGIVDVYPMIRPWPVRVEFFGDQVESIREFDPNTQLSRESISEVLIPPAGELGILSPKRAKWDSEAADAKPEPRPLATLVDYLHAGTRVFVVDPERVEEQVLRYRQQVPPGDPYFVEWQDLEAETTRAGWTWTGCDMGLLSGDDEPGIDLGFQSLEAFRPMDSALPEPEVAEARRREFFVQLHRWRRQNYRVTVIANNDGERERFGELWREYRLEDGTDSADGVPEVLIGALSRGFIHDSEKWVVITDAEIFGRYKVQRPRRLKSAHAAAMRSAFEINFSEFEEGDYVVHIQHGVGRYRGLQMLPTAKARKDVESPAGAASEAGRECLVIEFAPSGDGTEAPRLYVPASEAHLVGKYVGAGKARPVLNQMGGTRWAKAKEHATKAVRDLAGELLQIQAARASQSGHAFPSDSPWQREFEASFLYEETPDQARAIAAAKQDMESAKPMDRLVCGDVGFGKTEVAIRAAFKAVMGGKQVALLVPTTVLAQQHYNHFRERMADYPVRLELLSRFRTPRQQRAVLEAAANGSVDIVIGTHRLIQADTQFKDLGLVIVDEEQKFGVRHKETFKILRRTVDVLTLSATPIPRTLYLALTGARDLSTLETPPQDRLPVETMVANYDERLIRDAIQRELNRGGQVFFLHNRVSTIEQVSLRLKALLPDARIGVGHGQMDADELEKVMTRFVNGDVDVLVSTTIIESGIDIPNANTIIIDRADRFGLSELYQLRGRVGRYKHQAYAYLLLPRHAQLLTEARKRMSAIKQYSALGSGFRIAMRDLELRGAGNLLGSEQSGHITAVGFELYCQLLKQSIESLKGGKVKPRVEVRVRLDFLALNPGEEGVSHPVKPRPGGGRKPRRVQVDVPREVYTYSDFEDDPTDEGDEYQETPRAPAYLPIDYIREPAQRLEIHRRLAQAGGGEELEVIRRDLKDRFGPIPPPVQLLLEVGMLKVVAAGREVTVIEVERGKVKLMRRGDWITVGGQFPRLSKSRAADRIGEIRKLLMSLG